MAHVRPVYCTSSSECTRFTQNFSAQRICESKFNNKTAFYINLSLFLISKQSALLKNLATINYHERFPKSSSLTLHQQDFSHSFNVQFLGARGAGKSSLINKLRKILKVHQLPGVIYDKEGKTTIDCKAETGHSEVIHFTYFKKPNKNEIFEK